jgi:hypothetical protein
MEPQMESFAPPTNQFTGVDTLNTSNYLRAVISSDLTGTVSFLMPVTGFELNGQQVMPPGYDKDYSLYLTIDGTTLANPNGSASSFLNLDMTLWADPLNNDGTPGVSETSDPAFSHGMTNDIVLATGKMMTASMSFDPTTMVRSANFVDSMTPTLAGAVLLDGSIKPGAELEVKATTPPADFTSFPQPGGGSINLVSGGTTQITLDPQATIKVPNVRTDLLQLSGAPRFIHHDRFADQGSDGRDR